VDELVIYTPNFHPGLSGVDTLIEIFQPGTITLYATTPFRLSDEMLAQRLSADGETRTVYAPVHWSTPGSADATVIQWRTGEQTFVLAGLSEIYRRTFCLASHQTNTNFETAVLSQVDWPLLPWSTGAEGTWQARMLPLPAFSARCAS
jgi:hypothetical protein